MKLTTFKMKLMMSVLFYVWFFGGIAFLADLNADEITLTVWGWIYVALWVIGIVVIGCILNVLQEDEG